MHVELPKSMRQDYEVCRQIMRKASSNYWTATRVCPRDKIHHIEAIYAVLRIGDDLVDNEKTDLGNRRNAIELWREMYWSAIESGTSSHPVLRAFIHTARVHGIPPELLTPYFTSMIVDTTKTTYSTFEELVEYMEGSAYPAGRLFSYVFGVKTKSVNDAFAISDALAIAMQLTNFIRDIDEDFKKGRIYIPLDEMERFNCTSDDIALGQVTAQLSELLRFQVDRAMNYYNRVESCITVTWKTSHWAIFSALYIYRYILVDIINSKYDIFLKRAGATNIVKGQLLVKALLAAQYSRTKNLMGQLV